jgi:hypothetical protein
VKHLSGAPLQVGSSSLPTHIRLGWKGLPGTNALTYFEKSNITAVIFYNIGLRCQPHTTFFFVTDECKLNKKFGPRQAFSSYESSLPKWVLHLSGPPPGQGPGANTLAYFTYVSVTK